jgi:hypothetical protein
MRLELLTPDEVARVRALRAAQGKRVTSLLATSMVTLDVVLAGRPVKSETAQRLRAALARLTAG